MALQTATNPQTGETVVLVDGQWVPVSQTATNDKGQKAYLVNNQWLTDAPVAAPVKEAGFSLGDIAKSFGLGAVGSTKALTDVAGADNVVSSKLGEASKSIQESLTPERQAELQRQQERMKAAEKQGTWAEIKAGVQNIAEAPLQSIAQGIGSFVPYLPAMFAAPAAAAMRLGPGAVRAVTAVADAAPKVIGTAQGAGAVKSSIYDSVYEAEKAEGATEQVARQKATAAQEYFGKNFDQIALGAGLGLAASATGVEKLLTPSGRAAAQQSTGRRVVGAVAAEAPMEAGQGGQERLAANIAQQREGRDVDTFAGVAGQATQEGLIGALAAGPVAAIRGPGAQPKAETPAAPPAPPAAPPAPPVAAEPPAPVEPVAPPAAPAAPAAPSVEEPVAAAPVAPEPIAVEPAAPAAPEAKAPAAPKGIEWSGDYTENLPPEAGTFFQNRDRSAPASVGQMQSIAANPDYSRLSVNRDFGSGAPVVISDVPISEGQFGKVAYATASDGTRIPVRYAVVEGSDITPSNTSDGTKNPEYGDLSVSAIRPIAGNGRVAGLRAAYGQGTADNYKRELLEDTEHGIDPKIISGLQNPILVRVMPKSQVTPNIADISNISGTLRLSPVEAAKNDISRINLGGLAFNDDGSPNTNTLIQFVRSMPKDEQGELIDAKGMPNTKAIDRLNNAIFYKAYGSDTLIELYAQAADPEAKAVLNALAKAAPKMAALDGAGDYDVRNSVLDAAEMAVNARRAGQKLKDYVQQGMLGADPYAIKVLEMFADNSRSSKRMAEALDRLATLAGEQANASGTDMFGDVPKMPKDDLYKALLLEPEAEPDLFAPPVEPAAAAPAPVAPTAPAKPKAAAPTPAPTPAPAPAAPKPAKPKAAKPAEPKKPEPTEPTYEKADDPRFIIAKPPAQIAKEIHGLSIPELAQWSVSNAPNEAARAIAQRVADRINELAKEKVYPEKVKVLNNTQRWKSGTRGRVSLISVKGIGFSMKMGFNGVDNGVADSRTGTRYSTILHELIHAATVPQIFFAPNSKSVNDLKVLYKKVNDKIKQDIAAGNTSKIIEKITRGSNAMQNPAEIMAWGLTDAEFQKYLADIKIGDKTGFQKLVDIVRQVLGLAKDYESALDSLMKITGEMMDVSLADAEQDMKASNIPLKGIRTKGGRLMVPEKGDKDKAVKFYEDIPNERWLQGKIDYAQSAPRSEFGVPKMSSVTGYFSSPVMVPTRWFQDAKGQRGEEKNVRQKDLEAIRKIIRDTGKFPLNDDGTEYVPYVEIGYDGKPWISEGNHRIMAAVAEGLEYIPIELRYFDGGQRRAGKFDPENIKEITNRIAEERTVEQREPAKAPPTDSAAFKRWFGDSKVVDADGNPLVVYHGTDADDDFAAFDTTDFGSWFAENEYTARGYTQKSGGGGSRMIPVYLKIENPLNIPEDIDMSDDVTVEEALNRINDENGTTFEPSDIGMPDDYEGSAFEFLAGDKFVELVKSAGFDGMHALEGGEWTWNAFSGNQIKSSIGNKGAYSPVSTNILEEREARPLFFFDTLFKEQSESDRKQGYANRFNSPVTLKDGSRLSGFTDPKKQTTFHGYDKNGERFTVRAAEVNPNDIVFSKDANRTANKVREALMDVYGLPDVEVITTEQRVGKPTPAQAGQDALATLEATGMQLQPPEPGRIESIKKALKAAGEDPAMTKDSAKAAVKKFLDKMEVAAFSGDAAFNNDIRRNLEKDFADNPEVLGMLLEASQSQAVHADALATRFIVDGGVAFDEETKKWVAIKRDDNFIVLAKKIEKVADKYGLTKEQAEQVAHTYFVAKRFKDLLKKQNARDVEIERLKAELEEENANIKQYKKDGDFEKLRTSERAKNDIQNDIKKLEKAAVFISDDQRAMIEPGMSLAKNMPELEDISDTWQGIRANAVKAMIDGNLWSREYAESMLDNAAYVPFYRDEQLEEGGGPQEFIKGMQVKAQEFRLKGSNAAVNDVFDNMVRWTQYAINRSVRNHKALQMVDLGTELQVGDRKMAEKVEKMDPKKNTIRVFRDGVQEIYSMADPLYVDAFSAISNVTIPSLKFFTWFSNMLRQSVVLYPLFSVAQVPQDAFSAMFTSGLKPQYALRIPVLAVKEFVKTLAKTSATHKLLESYGATGVRDFNATVARNDIQIAAGLKGAKGLGGKTFEMLSHVAMAADNSIRQAVYEASMQQGLSKGEAIEKAFDIINFRRRGTSKLVNLAGQTVPFFYAYMSVQRTAYKVLTGVGISPQKRKDALMTLAATSGAVMALSLFYTMMNADDEEYQKTPTAIRDRTLNVPGTGGLRIPLRPDLFLMPKVLTEHLYHLITDNGLSDGAKFRKSVADGVANAVLSPQPIPQAIKPALEVAINYDFFQGRPLIGQFEKKKEAERQFNDNTSEFSKMLGNFGVSPIAADHVIRGMFGSAGGLFLYTTNFMINSDPDVPRPELTFRDAAAALPGTSGFITKASENALKTDFYALRDEVEKTKSTYNDIKLRSPQELEQFLSDEKNIARLGLAKGTEKIGAQLSKIRRAISQISNAPDDLYSASEKREAIKELRDAEKEMLKAVDIPALRKAAML